LTSTPPFQLVIVRDARDADLAPFDEAIMRAFIGGAAVGGYLATGEDLGIELKAFRTEANLEKAPRDFLDQACHTLVAVLAGPALIGNGALLDLIEACWASAREGKTRHSMLSIAQDDRVASALLKARPALQSNQILTAEELGERAMRPAIAALRTLQESRKLLAAALPSDASGRPAGVLRLFISHAKLDGLPLAQSLKHQIGEMSWLKSFYDIRDLADEADWERTLEDAATSATLIILRTEAYDGRPWCRQETLWAEEAAVPTVLVVQGRACRTRRASCLSNACRRCASRTAIS
jgi:hypothetical protein